MRGGMLSGDYAYAMSVFENQSSPHYLYEQVQLSPHYILPKISARQRRPNDISDFYNYF